MKHRHLRYIIFFGTVVLAALFVVQLYWFQKAFDITEKQFDHTIQVALKRVADSVSQENAQLIEVKKLSSNFYFVNTNSQINPHTIDSLVKKELLQRALDIDYELGVYDADKDTLVYGNYIQSTMARLIEEEFSGKNTSEIPLQNFAVYFPNKTSYLASEMKIWLFSTFTLFLMMGFFGYAMYSLLREKRYTDVKTDFINNLTHEFKTPVTNIQIASDVLKNKYSKSNEDILYFEILQKENRKLQQKIEHILTAATSEQPLGKDFREIDVHEVIRDCAESFQLKITQRNGKLELALDEGQPTVFGNRELLYQTFNNLIDNAEKYSPDHPTIRIESKNTEKGLLLTIMDRGIGIPKEIQKKVFHKFYRNQTGNIHSVKGFGLGLNFVEKVIRAHKGKIKLSSEQNQGTQISILLPIIS